MSTMYTKVDDSKAQRNKLSVGRADTLDVSDKTSDSLSARAYQKHQEHEGESHLAKTSMGNMIMAQAGRCRRTWQG